MEQWTVANETYAAALDDPDDALGRAYGVPTALSWDLEWYATAPRPGLCADGYEQAGVVHGVIELGGADPIHLGEVPAHRWHRWGDQLGPVELAEAFAHTGLRRRSPSPTAPSSTGCSRRTAGAASAATDR